MANELIETEDMLPYGHEGAQMDLALNLIDQYMGFVQHCSGATACSNGSASARPRSGRASICATC